MSAAMERAVEFQQQLEANRHNLSRNQLKKQRQKMKEMFEKAADASSTTLRPKCRRPGKRGRAAKAAAAAAKAVDAAAAGDAPTAVPPASTSDAIRASQWNDPSTVATIPQANTHTQNGTDANPLPSNKPPGTTRKKRRRDHDGRVADNAASHDGMHLSVPTAPHSHADVSAVKHKKKKKKKNTEEAAVNPSSAAAAAAMHSRDYDQLAHTKDSAVHTSSTKHTKHVRVEQEPSSQVPSKRAKLTASHGAADSQPSLQQKAGSLHQNTENLQKKAGPSHQNAENLPEKAGPSYHKGEVLDDKHCHTRHVAKTLQEKDHHHHSLEQAGHLQEKGGSSVQQAASNSEAHSKAVTASTEGQQSMKPASDVQPAQKQGVKLGPESESGSGPVVTTAVKKMLHFVPRSCRVGSTTSTKSSQTALPSSKTGDSLKSNAEKPPKPSFQELATSTENLDVTSGQGPMLQASISATTTIMLPSGINMMGDSICGTPIAATTTTTTRIVRNGPAAKAPSSAPLLQAQTAVIVSVGQHAAAEEVRQGGKAVGQHAAEEVRQGGKAVGQHAAEEVRQGGKAVGEEVRQGGNGEEEAGVEKDRVDQQGVSTSGQEGAGGVQPVALSRKKLRSAYVYGNYHRYYGYRLGGAVHQDPRLKVLEASWFLGKRCVDVGCNEGLLTLDVATHFKCKSMLGVDIDAGLVGKACRHLSLLRTKLTEQLTTRNKPSLWTDGMTMSDVRRQVETLTNTAFVHEEWVQSPGRKQSVDVVLCLSLTKWVHFHLGDEGIKTLFAKVAKVLTSGGVFVLEPQPWTSYVKTRKKPQMTTVPFQDLSKLKLRPDGFVEYLTATHGMTLIKELRPGDGTEGGFDRIIYVLQKNPM